MKVIFLLVGEIQEKHLHAFPSNLAIMYIGGTSGSYGHPFAFNRDCHCSKNIFVKNSPKLLSIEYPFFIQQITRLLDIQFKVQSLLPLDRVLDRPQAWLLI